MYIYIYREREREYLKDPESTYLGFTNWFFRIILTKELAKTTFY